MKTILEAFEVFGERLSPDAPFPAQDFVRVMEPVLAAEGYRTPRTAGEKMQMLVIMDAGVGDFLCFSGALRELRRLYPAAAITLMIFPPGFKLAEQCPYIDFLFWGSASISPSSSGTMRVPTFSPTWQARRSASVI